MAFPQATIDFMDVQSNVNPLCRQYQCADCDPVRRLVIFYPTGPSNADGPAPGPLGTVLYYNPDDDFLNPQSYRTADLTALVDANARGFGGGFVDDSAQPNYAYLPPWRNMQHGGSGDLVAATLTVRINLAKAQANPQDPTAYEKFDLAALQLPTLGWFHGTYCNGYAFYAPAGSPRGNGPLVVNGNAVRYDSTKAFGDPTAWDHFDLTQVHPQAKGFQSMVAAGPYVYFIPYGLGYSILVRYDTRGAFTDPHSYTWFDTSTLDATLQPRAFTGGVVVPDQSTGAYRLVLIPWKDSSIPATPTDSSQAQLMHAAVCYHTAGDMTQANNYLVIDLYTVDPKAAGYEYGWSDKAGLVWFVTTGIYNPQFHVPLPVVAWDSSQPFEQASSWHAYQDPGAPEQAQIPTSAGAAYDPITDTAWWAGWGSSHGGVPNPNSTGVITRVRVAR